MTVDRSAMFVAECCDRGDPQRHGLTHWIDSQRRRPQHRNSIGSIHDVLICNVAEVAVDCRRCYHSLSKWHSPSKRHPPKTSDDEGMARARKRAAQTMSTTTNKIQTMMEATPGKKNRRPVTNQKRIIISGVTETVL